MRSNAKIQETSAWYIKLETILSMMLDTWELWFEEKRHLKSMETASLILKYRWNLREDSKWGRVRYESTSKPSEVVTWFEPKAGAPEGKYQSWPPTPHIFHFLPFHSPSHHICHPYINPQSPSFNSIFPTLFPSINDQTLLSAFITMKLWMVDGPLLSSTVFEKAENQAWKSNQNIMER